MEMGDEEKKNNRLNIPQRCRNDGHEFVGKPHQFIIGFDFKNKPQWDPRIFCSDPCVKTYLRLDVLISPDVITWFEEYLMSQGLFDVPTAPDPVNLACYNSSGKGMSIEEYRDFSHSFNWSEVPPTCMHISKDVFIEQPQENNPIDFVQLHTQAYMVHKGLYAKYLLDGTAIPKAILDDEKRKLEKEAEDEEEAKSMAIKEENAIDEQDEPEEEEEEVEEEEEEMEETEEVEEPKKVKRSHTKIEV